MLGERIRERRIALGWTQSDLGALIQASDVTISRYENGERSPDPAMLSRLAAILGVTSDWLLGVDDHAAAAINDNRKQLLDAWIRTGQRLSDDTLRKLLDLADALPPRKKNKNK